MSLLAIWIDQKEAKLFEFTSEGLRRQTYGSHHTSHHTHLEDQKDHQLQEHHFFKTLAPHLRTPSEILVLGPGLAKHHFVSFLKEQHPDQAQKVVACENMDHPTEPQIIAFARKSFNTEKLKSYDTLD